MTYHVSDYTHINAAIGNGQTRSLSGKLRPRQDTGHLADDIFKWIFMGENVRISINILLKCVSKGQFNKILPALVLIMACRLVGAKPLS